MYFIIFQMNLDFTEPLLATFILIVVMLFSTYYYLKVRNWIVESVIFVFSLVIGGMSLSIELPMYPYFQVFFIVYEAVLFMLTSISLYQRFKE